MMSKKTLFSLLLPFILVSCGKAASHEIIGLIEVSSSSGNILISHAHSLNNSSYLEPQVSGSGRSDLKYDGKIDLDYISGDGKNFYRPVWANQAGTGVVASMIEDVTPLTVGDADTKMLDFTLKISRDAGPSAVKVYLGSGTGFETITSEVEDSTQFGKDDAALKSVRMSVYSANEQGRIDNKIFAYSPYAEINPKYMAKAEGEEVYGVRGFSIKDDLEVKSAPFETLSTFGQAEMGNYPALALLSDDALTTYVNFRIWLEGMDEDSSNMALAGMFRLNLDFYCLEVIE